jgi:hypothetical protein
MVLVEKEGVRLRLYSVRQICAREYCCISAMGWKVVEKVCVGMRVVREDVT